MDHARRAANRCTPVFLHPRRSARGADRRPAAARRGKLVHFEAYGYLDKAAGTPMRTDAIFNIASMTKPMVAVAALQLYEQGRLLMNDPLSKYFPKFSDMQVAVMDAKKETIVDRVP